MKNIRSMGVSVFVEFLCLAIKTLNLAGFDQRQIVKLLSPLNPLLRHLLGGQR